MSAFVEEVEEDLNPIIMELFKVGTIDDIEGFRHAHEIAGGSTDKQMMYAGVNKKIELTVDSVEDVEAAKIELMREYTKVEEQINLTKYFEKDEERSEKKPKIDPENEKHIPPANAGSQVESKRKIDNWMRFKKYFSWFTGRKMHREIIEKKLESGKTKLELKLTGNEDEHVLPFGFMLLFGGGIARVIDENDLYTAFQGTVEDQEAYLKITQELGQDLGIISAIYTNPIAKILLECMGYDTLEKKFEFCILLHHINYYGYFLSEGKANSVKTNHIFIRLSIDDNGDLIFTPATTRVHEFIKQLEFWSKSMNFDASVALDERMKTNKTQGQKSTGEVAYNRNKLNAAFLPRGWRISDMKWNPQIAEDNMKYILDKLCKYLNDDVENRLFFNIIMSKIYLQKKNQKRQSFGVGAGASIAHAATSVAVATSPKDTTRGPPPQSLPVGIVEEQKPKAGLDKSYFQKFLKKYPTIKYNLQNLIPVRDRGVTSAFLSPPYYASSVLVDRIKDFDPHFFEVPGGGVKRKGKKKRKKKRKIKSTKKKRRRKKRTRKRR